MKKEDYFSGQEVLKEDIGWHQESKELAVKERLQDLWNLPGVVHIEGGCPFYLSANATNLWNFDIGFGAGYNESGERLEISTNEGYCSDAPSRITVDGICIPWSTGNVGIPLYTYTVDTPNYIWLRYLETRDPNTFRLHEKLGTRYAPRIYDGYEVLVNDVPPEKSVTDSIYLGSVLANGASVSLVGRFSESNRGYVQTHQIADDSLTTVKYRDRSVTGDKIIADGICTLHLQDSVVTADKIRDSAVIPSKLDSSKAFEMAGLDTGGGYLRWDLFTKTLSGTSPDAVCFDYSASKMRGAVVVGSHPTGADSVTDTSDADFNAGTPFQVVVGSDSVRLNQNSWSITSSWGGDKYNVVSNGNVYLDNYWTSEVIDQQNTSHLAVYGATNEQYWAQSFKPSIDCTATKAALKICRVGSPPNITLYLLADNNNSPGSMLSSKTLSSASFTAYPTLSWVTFDFPDVNLTKDTRYWLYTSKGGDGSNRYLWTFSGSSNPYPRGNLWSSINGHWVSYDATFKVYEHHQYYYTSGYYTSPSKNTTYDDTVWGRLVWSETLNGQIIRFRVAANNDNATWSWRGPDGSTSSYYTYSGQRIWSGHDGNKYIKVRAYLWGTTSTTPYLHSFTVYYSANGDIYSAVHDTFTASPVWNSLVVTTSVPSGTAITLKTRTSVTGTGDWSTWVDVGGGGLILSPSRQYIQWRAYLTTDDGEVTPILYDVTLNWYGTGAVHACGDEGAAAGGKWMYLKFTDGTNCTIYYDDAYFVNNDEAQIAVFSVL